MELRTLMDRLDNIENESSNIKKYISEGLYATPEMQPHWKRIDENFFKGYDSYLAEVALTPDQIQSIFKQAGGGAGAEAPKDPGKLAALVDKVMPAKQADSLGQSLPEPNAGAVQGFEEKAASAVQNLPGVDSSTKQSLMQWVKAGIKKPETQQLILAAVGAGIGGLISKVGPIISMIPGGGVVASAITGAVVAGAVAVASAKLQGKDWTTAFKGAIKPALMGGASAVIGNLATTAIGAMTGGGDSAQQGAGGEGSPEQQKAIADDQARMDSFQQKFPPGEGYTYQGQGDRLQVFDANGNKVFSGDIPFKSMDASTFAGLAQNGQNVATMTNVGTGAQSADLGPGSEPRGAASGDMKPGDWNKMAGNKTSDGSPATLDQINQAKADLRAGNATDMSGPADAPIRPRLPPGASLSDFSNTSGENPNADAFRKQAQDQVALNQRMQAQADAGGDANASTSNQGRLKMDQWRQDVGSPNAIGKNFDAGIAPLGPDGTPMQAVPLDAPATQSGINRLTGKPFEPAQTWDQMTPDQQATVTARQQQQAADAAQGTQNAKDYWANKNPNTRGLKESFAESAYVDKQATLRMWLEQEAKGLAVSGLALKPTVKEGIMDSLKGMFGGKKGAAAPAAAGGVTADALNQAWTAAGSPTDSEEIAKILQSAGVAPDAVNKIFADLKLPAPTGKIEPKMDPEQSAATDPNAGQSAQSNPAAPAAGMKADEIVKSLSSFWDQVKSNQDSKSSAPQVQQQIKQMGKEAGMAGQVVEGKYSTKAVGFYSTFLGKDI